MATNIFEPIVNPVTGETFRGVSFSEEVFVMEWKVKPNGYVAFEHIHMSQDEIFHVKSGEIRVVMDGKEYVGKKGDTIVIPKGKPHIAYNNTDEALDCLVEYKPGLDQDVFMQCFAGLVQDNYIDKKGSISIPKMGYFLMKMKAKSLARPTEIPAPLFNIAMRFFYLRGVLSGWGKLYTKYTQ